MIDRAEMDDYAAEYVLGTLDHAERIQVAVLRASDAAMDVAVTAWEKRFAPFNTLIPEAQPSPDLFGKIERRVLTLPKEPERPFGEEDKSRFGWWQAAALVASLAFLIITAVGKYGPQTPATPPPMVAVLQTEPSKPMFVVSLNRKTAMIEVQTMTEAAPANKNYELWFIPKGATAPHPMGVLSAKTFQMPMPDMPHEEMMNVTIAVSLEPAGGSPTGLPTGPVIVTGHFEQPS